MRPRASAAVVRNNGRQVLMVKHSRTDGSTYWQLPGGGVLAGETAADTAVRELKEETGLTGTIARRLFDLPYRLGTSTTFLVEIGDGQVPSLGTDPEEVEQMHKKLIDVAWVDVAEHPGNPEIDALVKYLNENEGKEA